MNVSTLECRTIGLTIAQTAVIAPPAIARIGMNPGASGRRAFEQRNRKTSVAATAT